MGVGVVGDAEYARRGISKRVARRSTMARNAARQAESVGNFGTHHHVLRPGRHGDHHLRLLRLHVGRST